jgi:hypothetical protein
MAGADRHKITGFSPYFELLPVSGLSMNQKQRGKEKVITDHVVVVLMTERTSPKLSH